MKAILFIFLFIGIFSLKLEGIDVSSYQGTINWSSVAKSKYFAIIRAGTGWGGENNEDSKFEENYKNAKNAGVKVGAYWYSYARNVAEAKREAEYFMSHLEGKQFEWPVYYDIEEQSQFDAGIQDDIAKAFCDILEANHYYCGIYSGAWVLSHTFNSDTKTRYTIWVANWGVDKPSYSGNYDVWQKSSTGSVDGISGAVDLDEGYTNFEPIMQKYNLNGY